ncbi:MAG TPA: hypothetical protein VNM89_01125 [Solirubrobacterales bacterium]|nr:hypothetical protein [Solirubrobacterales bacterium]
MFNRIRDRFGTAGLIVSVVALVAALAGTAFAAAGLNSKQKSQVKAIAKTFAGKPGATGPAGPAGPAGANGAKGDTGARGADGTAGTDGVDGKTVRSGTTAPEGSVAGNTGDFYIRTSTNQIFGPKTGANGTNTGWGSATSLQGAQGNPGADGSPWVVGTAPIGATLKGTWSAHSSNAAANEAIPIEISFGVPVPIGDGGSYIVDMIPPGGPDPAAAVFGEPICTGSANNPTPVTGPGAGAPVICAYAHARTNLDFPGEAGGPFLFAGTLLGSEGGSVVAPEAAAAGPAKAFGSWAVTVAP